MYFAVVFFMEIKLNLNSSTDQITLSVKQQMIVGDHFSKVLGFL